MTLLKIRPPLLPPDDAGMDRGPLLAEAALSALHAGHEQFALEIGFRAGKVGLAARGSDHMIPVLRQQLYAQYPDVELSESPDDEPTACLSRELDLEQSDLQPLKTYPLFLDVGSRRLVDPIAAILSALDGEPAAKFEILITPAHHIRRRATKALPILDMHLVHRFHAYGRWLTRLRLARGWRRWPSWSLALLLCKRGHGSGTHAGAQEKLGHPLFYTTIRLSAAGQDASARRKLEELTAAFQSFALPGSNAFVARPIRKGLPKAKVSCLLSAQEVATLWHVPGPLVRPVSFDALLSRKLETPINLPLADEEGVTVLGEAVFRSKAVRFGIRQEDRRRHTYIVGKTGVGKSTFLENVVYSDIQAGRGVGVIDPHGDLVEACLRFIPRERTNDVLLIDPSQNDWPIAFNILDCARPEQKPLIASGLVSVMQKLNPQTWSGRASYILRLFVLALLDAENSTLLGILRMFSDEAYRRKIAQQIKDPVVRDFHLKEYPGWTPKYRSEAISTIQNKIGQVLAVPLVRNVIGQVRNKIQLRNAMDTRKIVLINLSKGALGEDVSKFLGGMLMTAFELAALSRTDVPISQRIPFVLVADEFQNMVSESFASVASESRKFGLALVLAHQYLGQLLIENSTVLQDAIWGNIGSAICFQTGADDAEPISQQFEGAISAKDIVGLERYHAYARLTIDGSPSKPFSIKTLPRPAFLADDARVETIRRLNRERYCEKREKVEKAIAKWMGEQPSAQKAGKSKPARNSAQRQA